MDELLRQLGDLALGSIPTLILFIVLVFGYRLIIYSKLLKIRAERRARTTGAVEKARLAVAEADLRFQEYEARLRAARSEIFRRREQRVQQWNVERDRAIEEARLAAQERSRTAQNELAMQAAEARKQIESATSQLANQVVAAILPAPSTAESSH